MPTIAAYLSELTARLEALLEDRLLGAWLIGSGALGGFDRLRSDVDVQAVCTARLARTELQRLATSLSHEALPCPVRGLEFVLYAREDLTDPHGPVFQLNLNTGPRMGHHAGYDPGAESRFWFVLDVAIAREHAHRLTGLRPETILPALPRSLVRSALHDALEWYRAHDGAQAVLAACRAWAWAIDGCWLSKGDAAVWATAQLADRTPVAKALARHADSAPGPTDRAGGSGGPRGAPARRGRRIARDLLEPSPAIRKCRARAEASQVHMAIPPSLPMVSRSSRSGGARRVGGPMSLVVPRGLYGR